VAFSADGQRIVSGSYDGTVRIWDVQESNHLNPIALLDEHRSAVIALAFSHDNNYILSASRKVSCDYQDETCGTGELLLWDAINGRLLRRFVEYNPPSDARTLFSVAFSADDTYALSGLNNGTVQMWQINTREELVEWACRNRHIPELTLEQRQQYGVPENLEICPVPSD
jgi:WD40 repeat protein